MRLAWARDHVTWTQSDWALVLFTDESRFCVDFTDRRARVWRMLNERFAPVRVAEDDRFVGSVMVWAGISVQGKTDLHVIDNGTFPALRYVNEILDVYVRPYAGAVGENFILMDDNARAHRAHLTDQYLEQATIVRMEWPARSPDLNPIEHAWDMLQTAVSSRPVQPASVQELRQSLLEEWDQIPQYKIRRLISSMRRLCQAVIEAGDITHAIKVHKTSKFLEILDFFIFMIAPKMLIFYHYVLCVSLTLKITPDHSIFNRTSIPKTLKFSETQKYLCNFLKIQKYLTRRK